MVARGGLELAARLGEYLRGSAGILSTREGRQQRSGGDARRPMGGVQMAR
jgi:hypothetical protein